MKRKASTLLFTVLITLSCSWMNQQPGGGVDFPLDNLKSFPVDRSIREIAMADTWIAIDTGDHIIAMDKETGGIIWSKEFSTISHGDGFLVDGDNLYAASYETVAVFGKDGSYKELNLGNDSKSITKLTSIYSGSLFLVDPSWNFEVYDLVSDQFKWEAQVGRSGGDEAYYVNSNGLVLVSGGSVRAYEYETGRLIWSHDRDIVSSAFSSGILYEYEKVGGDNYRINAVNINNQTDLWSKKFTFLPASGLNKLAVVNNLILLIGSDIIALDPVTGDQVWKTSTGEAFYTVPAQYNDLLFIKSMDRTVYAISPVDGSIVGSLNLEGDTFFSASDAIGGVYNIDNGIVFNTLHSIEIYTKR